MTRWMTQAVKRVGASVGVVVLGLCVTTGLAAEGVRIQHHNDAQAPAIDPAGGTFDGSVRVALTGAPGDTIMYSLDGSEPTEQHGQRYEHRLWISASATLIVRAFRTDGHPSELVKAEFIIKSADKVATPTLSPVGGSYHGSTLVTLATATADAVIYYTLNGDEPTEDGLRYHGPVWLTKTTTVMARAYKKGMTPSDSAKADYLIDAGQAAATPTISPAGGTFDGSVTITLSVPGMTPPTTPPPTTPPPTTPPPTTPPPTTPPPTTPPPTTSAPVVQITNPASGVVFRAPATFGVIASATPGSSGSPIVKVEFFINGVKQGEDTSSPYQLFEGTLAPHLAPLVITAKATDQAGASTTSAPVTITVKQPNLDGPTVKIVSITPGKQLSAPATFQITAEVTPGDEDDSISKVEFFADGVKIGEASKPYQFTWQNVPGGTYMLTAQIVNRQGEMITSVPEQVQVGVVNPPTPPSPTPPPTTPPSPTPPPTPSPTPPPPTDDAFVSVIEAESGALQPPMVAVNFTGASGGKVVSTPTADQGAVTYSVTVPTAGKYYIWGRINATTDGTFRVSADGGPETVYDIDNGVFTAGFRWTRVTESQSTQPRAFQWLAGAHTVKFAGGLANSNLDCVAFTNSKDFQPGASSMMRSMAVSRIATIGDSVGEGPVIYYTLGGGEPTPDAIRYTGPFMLTSSATVKAVAYQVGFAHSATAMAAYTIRVAPTRAIVTVTDHDTDKPIKGALVDLDPRSSASQGPAMTDDLGTATIEVDPALLGGELDKTFKLLISAKDYVNASRSVVLRKGMDTSVAIELTPVKSTDGIKLVVKLTDAKTGNPVAGASVHGKLGMSVDDDAISDASGMATLIFEDSRAKSARVTATPSLTAVVQVDARGYDHARQEVPISLDAENLANIALTPSAAGAVTTLKVTVTDKTTKKPIRRAKVAVSQQLMAELGSTNEDGLATLRIKQFNQDQPVRVDVAAFRYDRFSKTDLKLNAGVENTLAVELDPLMPSAITKVLVTVTDEGSKPVAAALVELSLRDGPKMRTFTGSDGVAALVIPVTMFKRASEDPRDPSTPPARLIVTARGYERLEKTDLTIIDGQENKIPVTLKPMPGAVLTTVIIAVTNLTTHDPIAGAVVELTPEDRPTQRNLTDDKGMASIVLAERKKSDKMTRPARLMVSARGFEPFVNEQVTLNLGAENKLDAALAAIKPGTLTKVMITVTDPAQAAVSGALVELGPNGEPAQRGLTDDKGKVTLLVADSKAMTSDGSNKLKLRLSVMAVGFERYLDEQLMITRGADTPVSVTLKPTPLPTITKVLVTVADAGKQPVVGAMVVLSVKDGSQQTSFTGRDGNAQLVLLDRTVKALLESGERAARLTVKARGFKDAVKDPVTIKIGADNTFNVTLEATNSNVVTKLTVTVTDEAMHPILGALVEVTPKNGNTFRNFTDAEGNATLVAPTDPAASPADNVLRVVVKANGYLDVVLNGLAFPPGMDYRLPIIMKRTPESAATKLTVMVFDKVPNPAPLAGASVVVSEDNALGRPPAPPVSGVTGPDGRAEIVIPAGWLGPVRIIVSLQAYKVAIREHVAVPDGQNTVVTVLLEPQ